MGQGISHCIYLIYSNLNKQQEWHPMAPLLCKPVFTECKAVIVRVRNMRGNFLTLG